MALAQKTTVKDEQATKARLKEAAQKKAAQNTEIARNNGTLPTQVAGTGPFGLPSSVSVIGVNVPTILILGAAGVMILAAIALVVHNVRKG